MALWRTFRVFLFLFLLCGPYLFSAAAHAQAPVILSYAPEAFALTAEHERQVGEDILPRMAQNPATYIEIRAYAQPSPQGESETRRTALRRATAIRDMLVKSGIEKQRIVIFPIGADRKPEDSAAEGSLPKDAPPEGDLPQDRVEITLLLR